MGAGRAAQSGTHGPSKQPAGARESIPLALSNGASAEMPNGPLPEIRYVRGALRIAARTLAWNPSPHGERRDMSRKARVVIDLESAKRLLCGKPVTIRVPEGATLLEVHMVAPPTERNTFAETLDVFFNGREAR